MRASAPRTPVYLDLSIAPRIALDSWLSSPLGKGVRGRLRWHQGPHQRFIQPGGPQYGLGAWPLASDGGDGGDADVYGGLLLVGAVSAGSRSVESAISTGASLALVCRYGNLLALNASFGADGMPRRTMIGSAAYLALQPNWQVDLPIVVLGGTLLVVSALCYFINMATTVAVSRRPATFDIPVAEAI
jgi:hypothetical protein